MAANFDFKRREGEEDTYCQQNASFYYGMTWETETAPDSDIWVPVPLAGWTGKMQVRRAPKTPVIVELSTENNRIVLDPANGNIQLQIASTDTVDLPPGLYRYDLQLINPDGFRITFLEGLFEIVSGITE